MINQQIILKQRPVGLPNSDTWQLHDGPMEPIQEGQILVENIYASIDPAMRGWINDRKSYISPVQIGDVMRASTIGRVIESLSDRFSKGDFVKGGGGIQRYSISDGRGWTKVDRSVAPLPKYLSVLGLTGFTAYFGLLDIGRPKKGETILVSGAAGAVGSLVGQIGKICGCKMVGIAGGPEKCQRLLDQYQFDVAIDYKNEPVRSRVNECCPEGIDIYFDNVGGDLLDIALAYLKFKGRVVLCGGISQYNATEAVKGPTNYLSLLTNRGRMEGFIVFDYLKDYPIAMLAMQEWMRDGKIRSDEHIEKGIEHFYPTFLKLFTGENQGKLILQLNELTENY
ncbi:MAG: NADP-dependent oxidoreductase [Saprospiraceae bacterium]|nr:NADP-dependent oxidoreductase [Saprospiraceae bacterium]